MPSKSIMQLGARIGHWVIVREDPESRPDGARCWICRCDCGTERSVRGANLRNGGTRSCGCATPEAIRAANKTHGLCGRSPEYKIWSSMRDRCLNPRARAYPSYGGRGITICPEWGDAGQFYADMGPRPSPAHSLDRIDNDGPYSPENCRWATPTDQQRNTRGNRLITFAGRTLPMSVWCEETGLKHSTLWERLRRGWSVERALTQKLH